MLFNAAGQIRELLVQIQSHKIAISVGLFFSKGSPQRVISALELLGTVMLVRLIAYLEIGGATDVTVRGITDSECNTYAFLRSYSRRLPAALIHMELMASCHAARIFPVSATANAMKMFGRMSLRRRNFQAGALNAAGHPSSIQVVSMYLLICTGWPGMASE